MVKTGHLKIFYSLEALHDHFEAQFFLGLQYYTILQRLITCRAMHLRFKGPSVVVYRGD